MGVRSAMLVRVRRLVVVCVALVLGSGLLAACTDDGDRPGTVPSDTAASATSGTSAAPTTDGQSAEDQIALAYTSFWSFINGDAFVVPSDVLHDELQKVTIDPQLTAAYEGVQSVVARGEVPFGEIQFGDLDIDLTNSAVASVTECRDETGTGSKRAATGEITSQGLPGVLYKTDMKLDGDQKWKLADVTRIPDGC